MWACQNKNIDMIKEVISEIKQSKWPTKKEMLMMTIYTLVFCGIITLVMVGLDLSLAKIRDWFLNM